PRLASFPTRRFSDMVHPNFDVSEFFEQSLAVFIQFTLFFSTWQVIFIKSALTNTFNPRHVSVRIESQTVRLQFQGPVDRIFHFLPGMERQSEYQVMGHTGIADFARPVGHPFYIFKGLDADNGFLYLRIIILNTKTAATEAQVVKGLQMFA